MCGEISMSFLSHNTLCRPHVYVSITCATVLGTLFLFSVLLPVPVHAQDEDGQATQEQNTSTVVGDIANAVLYAGSFGFVGGVVDSPINQNQNVSCDTITKWFLNFTTCVWRDLMAAIGGLFMMAAGSLLGLVSLVFNMLLTYTIMDFGSLYEKVGPGVELTWSSIRDIGQIVIIGGLVFVIFATIFGVERYGARQFAAKLIIVAIIINFSLFMTKSVIDASNFVAVQFLAPIEEYTEKPDNAVSVEEGAFGGEGAITEPSGVAGAFMAGMGIQSVGDTNNALEKVAENAQSGWVALFYGLMSGSILLAVAIVLIFGTYLLLVRAVSLIILLVISALALALFAIPRFNILWSYWWKLLLTNVIFAPLLAVLLWGTVGIMKGMGQTGGSLGNLVFEPGKTIDLQLFVNYLIILGLLYASFRIARSVSLITVGAGNEQKALKYGKWAGKKGLGVLGGALGFAGGLAAANRARLWPKPTATARAGATPGAVSAANRANALRQLPTNLKGVAGASGARAGQGAAERTRPNPFADRTVGMNKPDREGAEDIEFEDIGNERKRTVSGTAVAEISQESKMGRARTGERGVPHAVGGAGSASGQEVSNFIQAQKQVEDRKEAQVQGKNAAEKARLAVEQERTMAAQRDTVARSRDRRPQGPSPWSNVPEEPQAKGSSLRPQVLDNVREEQTLTDADHVRQNNDVGRISSIFRAPSEPTADFVRPKTDFVVPQADNDNSRLDAAE